jgi:hypothetical protein
VTRSHLPAGPGQSSWASVAPRDANRPGLRRASDGRAPPTPQASIEFEVADVAAAAAELRASGHRLIHDARTEPWGQTKARLLSPEGLLVAVCYTPPFHDTGGGVQRSI